MKLLAPLLQLCICLTPLVAQPPPDEVSAVEVTGLKGATAGVESVTLQLRKTFAPPAAGALLQAELTFRLPQEAPMGALLGEAALTRLVGSNGVEIPLSEPAEELWSRAETGGGRTATQPARIFMDGAIHLLRPGKLRLAVPVTLPLPESLSLLECTVPVHYPTDPKLAELPAKVGASVTKDGMTFTVGRAMAYKGGYYGTVECEAATPQPVPLSCSVTLVSADGKQIPAYSRPDPDPEGDPRKERSVTVRVRELTGTPAKLQVHWFAGREVIPVTIRVRDLPLPRLD